MIYTAVYNSPVGKLLIAEKQNDITGLWIEGQKHYLNAISDEIEEKETKTLKSAKRWLDRYFAGEKPEIVELTLKPFGSDFRKEVYKILCEIPYGKTTTYGEIAKQIAKNHGKETMSAQAVGGAVGHNPISIIIPCHRVIGKDGSLTGYAGGLDKKIALLTHEGANFKSDYTI